MFTSIVSNVAAYVFDSELIQSTIDEEEYRADNNENCVRRYGIVIPQGKSVYFGYDENNEFAAFEDDPKQLDNDYREAMGVTA